MASPPAFPRRGCLGLAVLIACGLLAEPLAAGGGRRCRGRRSMLRSPRRVRVRSVVRRRSTSTAKPTRSGARRRVAQPAWQPLFDGQSLKGWEISRFGGEGQVSVENGQVRMNYGNSMTGIRYTGEVPRSNYELRVEAMRDDGLDFFAALTFPVKQSHCTFVPGGWAGAVVGLSSIDGKDASQNETTTYQNIKDKTWYVFRVRVTDERIQAWIDNKRVVNQDIRGRKIGIRNEMDLSCPLGICAWESRSLIRKIEIRRLK